jgi:hypothetical protein
MAIAVGKTVKDWLQHCCTADLGNHPTEFRNAMAQTRWA